MTKDRIQMVFSLIFFFFSSFLFLSIIFSICIDNFDNLLLILFRNNGMFFYLTRILLFVGLCFAIYLYISRSKLGVQSKRYFIFVSLCAIGFILLLCVSFLTNNNVNEVENLVDIDSNNYYSFVKAIKSLVIDSVSFIYFVLIPFISYFMYQKKNKGGYFYQTYIKEIVPSINVSVIFLFGYCINIYTNIFYIIDIVLIVCSIILLLQLAIHGKEVISFYTIVNLIILISLFLLIIFSSKFLSQVDMYPASVFFYALGLLYWFLNISIKLESMA